jgi:hypothetical protein
VSRKGYCMDRKKLPATAGDLWWNRPRNGEEQNRDDGSFDVNAKTAKASEGNGRHVVIALPRYGQPLRVVVVLIA